MEKTSLTNEGFYLFPLAIATLPPMNYNHAVLIKALACSHPSQIGISTKNALGLYTVEKPEKRGF